MKRHARSAYLCSCDECRRHTRPPLDPLVVDMFEDEEEGVRPAPEPTSSQLDFLTDDT